MNWKEKELDNRLLEWGEWRARPIHALGYPSASPESRANQDGNVKRSSRPTMRCKETQTFRPRDPVYGGGRVAVLEVEECYHAITNREWRAVLVARYVHDANGDDGAIRTGLSRRAYFERLAQVRAFMLGWLRI